MADVITRFKLETTQYDSKLRDAVSGMKNVVHMAELAGKDFKGFSDKTLEAAKSLGSIETGATNAKDKVKELVSAYNSMASTYNTMTKAMREDDAGKALAESLQTLKGRIAEAKQELYGMKDTGGVFDSLKDKLTINVDALKLFNAGVTAAKVALDVAKDAFFASEANIDEWGRIVASSTALYEGFLTAINTGDISGYLNNISQIVTAAREAYDELDKLGTMQTIQAPQKSGQQKEIERMRLMLRTGVWIDKGDGSTNQWGLKQGDRLNKDQLKIIEWHLKRGVESSTKLIEREVKQATKSINALYNKEAKNLGLSVKEFRQGTSSWEEFNKRIEGYRRYKDFEENHTTYKLTSNGNGEYSNQAYRDNAINPDAQYAKWGVFKDDSESYKQIVQLILQRDQWDQQRMQMVGQAYQTMNRLNGITPRKLMGGSGSGSGAGSTVKTEQAELQKNQKLIADLITEYQGLADKVKTATGAELVAADDRMTAIKSEIQFLQQRNDALKQSADIAQGKLDPKNIKVGNPSQMGITMPVVVKDDTLQQQVQKIADAARAGMANTDIADPLLQNFRNVLVDSNTLGNLMKTAIDNGITGLAPDFTALKEQIAKGIDIDDSVWQELKTKINEQLKALNIDPIKIDVKTGNITSMKTLGKDADEAAQNFSKASSAVGSIGSALQSLEDPGAKVAGIIANAIATIAQTFAASLKGTFTPWDWIAGAAAGTYTMVSTIAAIKSATAGSYAEGGIIPGNNYNDGLIANVSSGELILNRAQQNNIAQQLEPPAGGNGGPYNSYISGEQLVTVINAYGRRTGRGEILR